MLTVTNEDNMELMARYPDNYFDLAIVDPPYGIMDKIVSGGETNRKIKIQKGLEKFNDVVPDKEIF
jgi:site-specific DNA-methyltransferase (adenine-specific)